MPKKILIYFLALLLATPIFYFWWKASGSWWLAPPMQVNLGPGMPYVVLGRLAGLLGVYFILIEILMIARVRWLERTFGQDKLAYYHHWNGFFVIALLTAHPFFLTIGYAANIQTGWIAQFINFNTGWEDVLNATIGYVLLLTIIILSISFVRRRVRYEWWYLIHLITYGVIILAFGHQTDSGGDFVANKPFTYYWYFLYAFFIGNAVWYRFVVPVYRYYCHRFVIERIVLESSNAVSIYIKGKEMEKFSYIAGQFIVLRIINKKLWWQAHPFSISAHPGSDFRITVKQLGDYTKQISAVEPGTPVIIEGPYGSFTPTVAKRAKSLLVAGGVGITPLRAIAESMLKEGKDVVLLYGNRNNAEIIFRQELEDLTKNYSNFRVYYIMSHQEDWMGEKGRVDIEKIKRLVPDVSERDLYICGPTAMMDSIVKHTSDLGVPHNQIHFEKFAY